MDVVLIMLLLLCYLLYSLVMNKAVTVMSRSMDESLHVAQQLRSASDSSHTNFSVPFNQPINVAQHPSSYERPLTAPYMSHGRVPQCSVQIPDPVVPNVALFTNNQWYQKPDVGSSNTSCYAPSTQTDSMPVIVETVTSPQVLQPSLPSPPVIVAGKSWDCDGTNKDSGSYKPYTENCSGMTVDPSKASSSSHSSSDFVASSVASTVVSGKEVVTAMSGTETTVATSSSSGAITPRPKCSRAKTNAELKRQLMERREQRLRDMLENSSEGTLSSCTCTGVASSPACRQTEAAHTAVVSFCNCT